MQQQIDNFTRSLDQLATQYADPAIILQHIPVLKNNLMFQQNPEYIMYGVGGLIAGLFMLRALKKRRKSREKNIAMVMPQPYLGDADHTNTNETAPASFDKTDLKDEIGSDLDIAPQRVVKPTVQNSDRTLAEQLTDVSTVRYAAQSALSPNEARARVMIQAALNEFGSGYMIMARTALSAILQPANEAVGSERAQAKRAIQDKFLDFGVFDRTGRCIVAIEITESQPAIGNKALEKAIVRSAISQANLAIATLNASDTPKEIYAKLAPFLKATARAVSGPVAQKPKRALSPERPKRPVRPVRPIAIAAE